MSAKAVYFNLVAVRRLMQDAFASDVDLRRFCLDRPYLAPVLHSFGSRFSLDDAIEVVLVYCRRHELLSDLLFDIRATNPRQYQRYEAQLRAGLHDTGTDTGVDLAGKIQRLLEKERISQAVDLSMQARHLYPENQDIQRLFSDALFRKGTRYYVRHEFHLAARAFQQVLEIDPFHTQADRLLADAQRLEKVPARSAARQSTGHGLPARRSSRQSNLVRAMAAVWVVGCASVLALTGVLLSDRGSGTETAIVVAYVEELTEEAQATEAPGETGTPPPAGTEPAGATATRSPSRFHGELLGGRADCGSTGVQGSARTAAGAGVPGVSVAVWAEGWQGTVSSPSDDSGQWGVFLGDGALAGVWYVAVVVADTCQRDADGRLMAVGCQPLSNTVAVETTADCTANGAVQWPAVEFRE